MKKRLMMNWEQQTKRLRSGWYFSFLELTFFITFFHSVLPSLQELSKSINVIQHNVKLSVICEGPTS